MATKTNTEINGQNYYRIRKVVGHKNGRPVQKAFYGSSKADAEKKYLLYMRLKDGGKIETDDSTLHDRAIEYIDTTLSVSQKYTEGTKRRYISAYNVHINGTWIDELPLKDIKVSDMQQFYNALPVSVATLEQINRFMSSFYKWAVRNDYGSNIIESIELPIKEDTKRSEDIEIWDDEYWGMLTSRNLSHRHDLLIKLLCYAGLRIGEALGLKYGDIHDGMIHVNRQLTEGTIKEPKYKSNREIPIHDKVADALLVHKHWHKLEMKENGYKTDYIFTTRNGSLYDYNNILRAFKRIYVRYEIPYNHFHVYRSTFCTKLCEADVPLEVASKLLGHKSLEVTAKHYALIRDAAKENAISKLK